MDENTTENRRTFLSWLHFAVVLGGLAVGLLNFGDKVRSFFLASRGAASITRSLANLSSSSHM